MVERAIAYTIMAAAVAISINIFIAAVHDTDRRMEAAEQACAAKGGVLIDTSGGYKCYNREGEEEL